MSLDTYANLKAEIRDWSHRNDMPDSRLDTFIDIAEQAMYAPPPDPRTLKISNPLRLRVMEVRATATLSTATRFLELPEQFMEMRRLKLNLAQGDPDVEFLAPEQMRLTGTSGIPRFFSVTSQLEFDRTPDSAYTIEMQYIRQETPLSDISPTNAVLTNFPTVYLYGALWQVYLWTNQETEAAEMFTRFIGAIDGANNKDRKGRYGTAPRIRMEGPTP